MLSIVKCVALNGIQGFIVDVQVDVSNGIPKCDIVGLPDASIRESKERVSTAIKNSGLEFPKKKIIINLAPATVRKEGTALDLSIAIAIISANKNVNVNNIQRTLFVGELGIDGNLIAINGILPICIEARRMGFKRVIIPEQNCREACIVDDIEIIPVKSLKQVVMFLNNQIIINPAKNKEKSYNEKQFLFDFSDVKGQKKIKRALEIAASGGHNCLLIGSPGSGKTMMAKRIQTILPSLTFEEAIEVTKIHSIAGKISNNNPLIVNRPFVSPHYSITKIALVGGYREIKPGEISIAHNGILFLDELPEFDKSTLDALRGPLEDGEIQINRSGMNISYPCKFMLIASMNPCPCGFYGSDNPCKCNENSIRRYLNKVSGPLLDRIDIQVEVERVKYHDFNSENKEESSATIKERVKKARNIQNERYKEDGILLNSELNNGQMKKYCKLDKYCEKILEKYFDKLKLSARAYSKILKVARTIADMDGSKNIEKPHILEAVQYRNLDKF